GAAAVAEADAERQRLRGGVLTVARADVAEEESGGGEGLGPPVIERLRLQRAWAEHVAERPAPVGFGRLVESIAVAVSVAEVVPEGHHAPLALEFPLEKDDIARTQPFAPQFGQGVD